jgi:hypothetical protein
MFSTREFGGSTSSGGQAPKNIHYYIQSQSVFINTTPYMELSYAA